MKEQINVYPLIQLISSR